MGSLLPKTVYSCSQDPGNAKYCCDYHGRASNTTKHPCACSHSALNKSSAFLHADEYDGVETEVLTEKLEESDREAGQNWQDWGQEVAQEGGQEAAQEAAAQEGGRPAGQEATRAAGQATGQTAGRDDTPFGVPDLPGANADTSGSDGKEAITTVACLT